MSELPDDAPETEQDRRKRLALHAESARAAFFAVAGDVLETMKAGGVAEAEACVMTGALEMAIQTWVQVAFQSGVSPSMSRKTLVAEVGRFYQKHLRIERLAAEAPAPAKSAIEQ